MAFIQFVAPGLLSLAVGAYDDDVFFPESRFISKSCFWAFKSLCPFLGFNTSGRKDQSPSASMHLLGADVAMLKNAIRTCATSERARKLRDHIAQALQTNCLTPTASSKIWGRLGFYTSLLMGRLGRGMMGPSIRRQYGSRAHLLTPELERNILRRCIAIGTLPPMSIPLTLLSPLGAHSEAQGHGHIATRALLPNGESVSTHLP